jgi:large-conductance mechanosensitive channel
MFIILIILGAIVIAFVAPGLNPILRGYNTKVDAGEVSSGTTAAMKWNLGFLTAIAGIGLLGFAVAMVIRSIEVSNPGQ